MANVAIVALPNQKNDVVDKVASGKAHLTILFLGEQSENPNLQLILDFVEHLTTKTLNPFGLMVERRDELGEKPSDVLILEKTKRLTRFRETLLQDDNIRIAYENVPNQREEYIPHVTLGDPENPANEDEYPEYGINWIEFDRIAVWIEDEDGPEFLMPIKSFEDDVEHNDVERGKTFIEQIQDKDAVQAGVKGMKWGVRKDRPSSGSKRTSKKSLVKKEISEMSDEDLRKRINRLQMEVQLGNLTAKPKSAGRKFVQQVLYDAGKQVATQQTAKGMSAAASLAFGALAKSAPAGSTQKAFLEAMAKQGKKG